ncbi:NAD(P)H-dependent oxidoreductase [Gallaecimonas mangrovi]|uniref:NAD(P)H-dependent oxidoreductase n=1 Tax=Gallaecimonas mangrovi TaxID=2291597 RepID=UPI000E1FCF1D|nr:NAD(P)H-dependent oxidoreductase [Gallaecimonas mangrovi]
MKNVLIINAHQHYPDISPGRLTRYLVEVIADTLQGQGFAVRHSHIDSGYDVQEELDKHLWADVIILQAPVNWFGAPWKHKKYLDEVFNAGLAQQSLIATDGRSRHDPSRQYGTGGLMQGKSFMMSLTWNAPAAAFGDPNQVLYQGKTDHDAFLHIAACYRFCGAAIVPTHSCFDVMKNPDIAADVKRLKAHLATHFAASNITTQAG